MKTVNQIIHLTDEKEKLKSILNNGFYCSYALESFSDRKILIPMISFSNVLFRDIGPKQLLNYGKYGIGFSRKTAIELDLNPVNYVYPNSIIEDAIKENHLNTILPQLIDHIIPITAASDYTGQITNHINFDPLDKTTKDLINAIDKDTSPDLVVAIKNYSEKIYWNSQKLIHFCKPYKILDKLGNEFVVYNEREWRKCFLNLKFFYEKDASNETNVEFQEWKSKNKPHFAVDPFVLRVPIEKVEFIIVSDTNEILELTNLLKSIHGNKSDRVIVNTLEYFKKNED